MGGERLIACLAAALLLAAAVAGAVPRPAAAATNGPATLVLTPAIGPATATISMTYTITPVLFCPGGTATFTWDAAGTSLGTARVRGSACSGSLTASPPTGAGAGPHTVTASADGFPASATFTVVAPSPSPTSPPASPPPTPKATPTPAPSPTATDTPPPPTAAVCDTNVPQATASGGFLDLPGVAGTATGAQHPGAIVLSGVAPSAMLPPALGSAPLTPVVVSKLADGASPALIQAVASGARYPCVHLELGPTRGVLYTTYAFHNALLQAYAPAAGLPATEQLTLSYDRVAWEYQPSNGSPVVTGGGELGTTPDPRPSPTATAGRSLPPFPLLLVLVAIPAGLGWLWLRRRSRRFR